MKCCASGCHNQCVMPSQGKLFVNYHNWLVVKTENIRIHKIELTFSFKIVTKLWKKKSKIIPLTIHSVNSECWHAFWTLLLLSAFIMPVFAMCEAYQYSGIITCKCEECPAESDPVCGSNNKTYPNECMMRQEACKKNKTNTVQRKGSCGNESIRLSLKLSRTYFML